jgi:hypothetical protein
MHRITRRALRVAMLAAGLAAGAGAHPQSLPGWTADFTVRVESAGKRPVTDGPARRGVSGSFEWTTTHELRGTLPYTQRLRGAVARNQPDPGNEQRYESWLARGQRVPARLTLHSVRTGQSSGVVVAVDGEGAAGINKANAGRIGKIEHERMRTEVRVDADDGARMGGASLQIDRVANQVRFEMPTVEIRPERATVVEQRVTRLGAPPAAGEWDRNESFTPRSDQELRIVPQLRYPLEFVFDVPAAVLSDAKEIRLTQEFKAGLVDYEVPTSRGVITVVLRRGDPAGAAAGNVAPATAVATAGTTAAPAAPAAQPPAMTEARQAQPATAATPTTPAAQDAIKAVDKLRGLFGR